MKILVINAGSSSLKYELFHSNGKGLHSVTEGIIERIGLKGAVQNHREALKKALNELLSQKAIKNLAEIGAIGHRVVHGGEKYWKSVKIAPSVLKTLKKMTSLAPLHNPPNIAAIEACRKLLPKIPNVAVFDTAFHHTLEPKAFLYAIPYELYTKHGIRRFGFHGTSHAYVSRKVIKLLKKRDSKIITCHIGNGVSLTAVKNGASIDTSMGYTPLEGVPMGTRSGDMDPAVVYKLMEKLKLNSKQIDDLLNKQSGLKGFFKESSDMRDLWSASKKKNRMATLAMSIQAYRIAKYIGAYSVALKGLDAIAFTAGIGEHAWYMRDEICSYLPHLGVYLDPGKNQKNALEISSKKSRVRIFAIPTDEEKEIAAETMKVVFKQQK